MRIFVRGIVIRAFLLTVVLGGCVQQQKPVKTDAIAVSETESITYKVSIEKDKDVWNFVSGKWQTRQSEPENQWVLAQTRTDQEFNVALFKKSYFSDVDMSVQFRPLSGKTDASGGVIFRSQDSKNYYLVRGNSLENNFRFYVVVNGNRKQLASATVQPPSMGKWHSIKVVMIDNHLQAYLDGTLLIETNDDTFTTGGIGLWTKADSVTEFKDLQIKGVQVK